MPKLSTVIKEQQQQQQQTKKREEIQNLDWFIDLQFIRFKYEYFHVVPKLSIVTKKIKTTTITSPANKKREEIQNLDWFIESVTLEIDIWKRLIHLS